MEKYFLGKLEKLDTAKMNKHFCKQCNSEFEGPTQIQIEEKPNEAVADGLILIERGQYTCCLLYTSPSPRDYAAPRMPSSA